MTRIERPELAAEGATVPEPAAPVVDLAVDRAAQWITAAAGASLVVAAAISAARRSLPAAPAAPLVEIPERTSVDLNRAGAVELALLPRVGPAIAARIVESRREQGAFQSVDDLERVPGIGPVMLERIRPWASAANDAAVRP